MTEQDRATLVVSFRRMAAAARRINEVLRNNNYLLIKCRTIGRSRSRLKSLLLSVMT
jgi:hypothetical protein